MIRSMTGFGRGESVADGHRVLVEIRSVNHRFLNTNVRLPREFAHLDGFVSGRCSERCERGHVAVSVEVEAEAGAERAAPRLDHDLLDRLLEIAGRLEGLPEIRGGLSIESLIGLPGVLVWDPATGLEEETFREAAGRALDTALEGLVQSRRTEGEALERDLRERLATVARLRERIEVLAPEREGRERERLRAKLDALLGDASGGADAGLEDRVAQEIVLLADRLDVSEELTRLGAHLAHFGAELDTDGEAVGRKLTFLLQEIGRETNTIAAKANDAEMQRLAIEIKSELEKMREQAENVE